MGVVGGGGLDFLLCMSHQAMSAVHCHVTTADILHAVMRRTQGGYQGYCCHGTEFGDIMVAAGIDSTDKDCFQE
jgi:hypothetical protein